MAHIELMKTTKRETKRQAVSPIVPALDSDGNKALGFTVYCGDDSFYNVMCSYSANDYEQVLQALTEQRRQILETQKTKEKK